MVQPERMPEAKRMGNDDDDDYDDDDDDAAEDAEAAAVSKLFQASYEPKSAALPSVERATVSVWPVYRPRKPCSRSTLVAICQLLAFPSPQGELLRQHHPVLLASMEQLDLWSTAGLA